MEIEQYKSFFKLFNELQKQIMKNKTPLLKGKEKW